MPERATIDTTSDTAAVSSHDTARLSPEALHTLRLGGTIILEGVSLVPSEGSSVVVRLVRRGEEPGMGVTAVLDDQGRALRLRRAKVTPGALNALDGLPPDDSRDEEIREAESDRRLAEERRSSARRGIERIEREAEEAVEERGLDRGVLRLFAASVIPAALLFIVMQKYLVKGIQLGAVKG